MPAAGQCVDLALDAVQRRGQRHGRALPNRQFGLVGAPAHVTIRVGSQVAYHAHRQFLPLAVQLNRHAQLRRDVAVQLLPRRRAGDTELRGQRLLVGRHQVPGLLMGLLQNEGVIAGHGGLRDQRVDVEPPDPGREPCAELHERHDCLLKLAVPCLGLGIPRVGGDEAGDIGAQRVRLVQQIVEPPEHRVKGSLRHRAGRERRPPGDALLVEQLAKGRDPGADPAEGLVEFR